MTQITNTSFLYTTHCLQEAERLCDRVVIMIRGQTSCIGSLSNLKRDINGYKLLINGNDIQFQQNGVLDILKDKLGEETNITVGNDKIYAQIELGIKLSTIYEIAEDLKRKRMIDDFWVSEKDLNDVFERCLDSNEAVIGNDDPEYGYNDRLGGEMEMELQL